MTETQDETQDSLASGSWTSYTADDGTVHDVSDGDKFPMLVVGDQGDDGSYAGYVFPPSGVIQYVTVPGDINVAATAADAAIPEGAISGAEATELRDMMAAILAKINADAATVETPGSTVNPDGNVATGTPGPDQAPPVPDSGANTVPNPPATPSEDTATDQSADPVDVPQSDTPDTSNIDTSTSPADTASDTSVTASPTPASDNAATPNGSEVQ